MRTERQIEASRANGAKSRGPVTPEGKRNSCGNALKHGLLADTIVLKGELEERFLELLADFESELQPETTMEYLLVQKMAAAQWRQFRLWGMEKAAMEYQIRKQVGTVGRGESNATRASLAFQALSDDSRALDLFHRYDSLCDRQYLRAHKRFLELRRGRGDSPAPAPSNPRPEVPPAPEPSAPQDLDTQPVWEPFIPEPSSGDEQAPGEPTNEKQPNEPDNSLETLEPAAVNPTLKSDPRNPDPPHACASASETARILPRHQIPEGRALAAWQFSPNWDLPLPRCHSSGGAQGQREQYDGCSGVGILIVSPRASNVLGDAVKAHHRRRADRYVSSAYCTSVYLTSAY